MKKLVAFSILLALTLLAMFQSQTNLGVSATPIPGANSDVSKVWWNSTDLVDQTTAANNPTPSDVQLAGEVGDIHYVGHALARFNKIYYNITGGIDVSGGVLWEYWNGSAWKGFPTVVDSSRDFTRFGVHTVDFVTAPGDWTQATVPASPRRLSFPAYYARAVTVRPYASDSVPLAAQASLLLVPISAVAVTVNMWNGTGVPDANVSLWLPGPPAVKRIEVNASRAAGIYEFSSPQHQLANGDAFFIRVAKFGYMNITTPVQTYDASLPLNDVKTWILHGSLQVRVQRAFSPFTPVSSPAGLVTDGSIPVTAGTGIGNGTMEFGVDWRMHPRVNVTVSKPGWVTQNTTSAVTLTQWTTTTVSLSLQTTVRVMAMSEQPLGQPIPLATVTIRDSTGTTITVVDNSTLDQDRGSGAANGIVYLALNPSAVTNPLSVTVSRPGFSNWAVSRQNVTSLLQLNLTSSNQYGLRVKAWDELNGTLTLAASDTSFSGLVISQVDYFMGTAYMAADPASPGRLTITKTGYVSSQTFATVRPPSPDVFINQTIIFRPTGGNGPGLPFTVKVVSIANELGTSLTGASVSAPGVPFPVASGGQFYLPLPASATVNVTATALGYVDTNASVTPVSASQTTVRFGTSGSSASVNAPGLLFTVRVAGVFDELGNMFQVGVDATVTASQGGFADNVYLAADSTVTITASAPGYVNALTAPITPTTQSQTTVKFGTAGPSANVTAPALQFNVKVIGVFNELGAQFQVGGNATLTSSVGNFILSSGNAYLAAGGTVTISVSASGYVNETASVSATSSSQTTILFKTGGTGATIVDQGLLFVLKVHASQTWDSGPVQAATVEVFSDAALTNRIASYQSDASGDAYFALGPSTIYVQVSKTGYPTYQTQALQVSSASQTVSTASFAGKTTSVIAADTTVTITANTNISNPEYNSATRTVSMTSASPVTGNVNVTIPKELIPSGYTIRVTSSGQTVAFQSTEDPNNVYLQIPTSAGTSELQIAFLTPGLLQSPLVLAGIIVAVLILIGVAVYGIMRRRRPVSKQMPKPK